MHLILKTLVGTTGNDTLTGDSNANIITGGTGTDTLNGAAGNDTLYDDINHCLYGVLAYSSCTSGSQNDYGTLGNDTLNGNAGDDILIASAGDDTLDGGTGADTLTGGSGTDTFIIRANDGGSSITDADTITDFTDGTDILGLDSSVNYSDLSFLQSGSDTVILKGSEYLVKLTGISRSAIGIPDFSSTSTSSITFNGSPGNDTLIGGSGNDVFNTGNGNDSLYGNGGNDTFTVSSKTGSFTDYIDGGSGTDTATINYSGISNLQSFVTRTLATDGTTLTLVDTNGGTITLKNIINTVDGSGAGTGITVGSIAYDFVDPPTTNIGSGPQGSYDGTNYRGQCNSTEKIHGHAYTMTRGVAVDNTNKVLVLYKDGNETCTIMMAKNGMNGSYSNNSSGIDGYNYTNTGLTVYGYSTDDYITTTPQNDTIFTYSGNDMVLAKGGIDTIDLGSDDDVLFVNTSDLSTDASLDGGTGSDTLNFGVIHTLHRSNGNRDESYDASVTIDMTSLGNASNFENLVGTTGNDTLTGDSNANIITGGTGTDTLNGAAGNDTLYDDINHCLYGVLAYSSCTSGSQNDYGTLGNDTLNGNAGDDILIASAGDDTLDGGTGADTLTGGSGTDTFIIRANDGGSSITDADTITDFTDGTDLIGMDGLNYSQLTIQQGSGDYSNHVVVRKKDTNEYLIIIQNSNINNINNIDIVSTSTISQTLDGTSGNDTILGAFGDDTVTTGAGNDIVFTFAGDDSITIDGSGDKNIDGGSGTDTATINYSGISNLQSFVTRTLATDGTTLTLVDTNGGTITLKNIINTVDGSGAGTGITVGSIAYDFVDPPTTNIGSGPQGSYDGTNYRGQCNSTEKIHGHAYTMTRGVAVDNTNKVLVLYKDGNETCTIMMAKNGMNGSYSNNSSGIDGYNYTNTGLTVYGYSTDDYITTTPQNDTIFTYSGNDMVLAKGGIDTIDLGSDDDVLFVNTSDLSTDASLDGGTGSDTLNFGVIHTLHRSNGNRDESYDASVTIDMTSLGNASNFENLVGTTGNDTLTGDSNANIITGGTGTDTLNGAAGNDTLYDDINHCLYGVLAYSSCTSGSQNDYGTLGNDTLNGNAGDDILIASAGDDTLDGGTGADTLTGGSGTDTFIIRANDGGSSITDADTITDFTDGTDLIGMDGLERSQLTVEQGTGSYSSHVVVKKTDTGEFLIVIQNISLSSISDADFSAI
jgi:Ca2+-binding RTX toxin-like protein